MTMTDDSKATILLCTELDRAEPLSNSEWKKLRRELEKTGTLPGELFLKKEILKELNLTQELQRKIEVLLDRSRFFQIALKLNDLREWGIEVTTIYEDNYPFRLRKTLKDLTPPVLFYIGDLSLAEDFCIGVVGARKIGEKEREYTRKVAQAIAESGGVLVSGGAKGTDETAEKSAIEMGGRVISIRSSLNIKDDLDWIRENVFRRNLLVLSAKSPGEKERIVFTGGGKKINLDLFERNNYIYGLSEAVFVVTAYYNKNEGTKGTYLGAKESLKKGWTKVYVREEGEIPSGNRKLLEDPSAEKFTLSNLREILMELKSMHKTGEDPHKDSSKHTEQLPLLPETRVRKKNKNRRE